MPQAKPIPEGMHTVTPQLVCAGAADAIEFYKKAFNAAETARLPGPQGKIMHAMIRIGDSPLMLVDEFPEWRLFRPCDECLGGPRGGLLFRRDYEGYRFPEEKPLVLERIREGLAVEESMHVHVRKLMAVASL